MKEFLGVMKYLVAMLIVAAVILFVPVARLGFVSNQGFKNGWEAGIELAKQPVHWGMAIVAAFIITLPRLVRLVYSSRKGKK